MNILHVIMGIQKAAGTSVFCMEICDELKRMGENVTIAVLDPSAIDRYPSRENVCVVSIDSIFDSNIYGIVHFHGLWHPILHKARIWASKQGVAIVWSPHGMLTPWALSQKKIKKWMALALYQYWDLRRSSLLHVTAASELEDVRRLGLKQQVAVVPLGVNIPVKSPSIRYNKPKIALFVSRIHPKKGLFYLVDAWATVKKNSCNRALGAWKFIIAGPDQDGHAADVMARARAAGIENDFEIVGPVFGKEKEELYAKADLFVLPTFSENFGVVVIEALAYGCPVITTKGTPWAELMGNSESSKVLKCESAKVRESGTTANRANEDDFRTLEFSHSITSSGRCGWWIDIGVEPLVKALKEAMALSDDERQEMGRNGKRLVESKYTWNAVAQQMKQAYEKLLRL